MAQLKGTNINGNLTITENIETNGNVRFLGNSGSIYSSQGKVILESAEDGSVQLNDETNNLNLFGQNISFETNANHIAANKPVLANIMRITGTGGTALTLGSSYARVRCGTVDLDQSEFMSLSEGGILFSKPGNVLVFGSIGATGQGTSSRMSGAIWKYRDGAGSQVGGAAVSVSQTGQQSVHTPVCTVAVEAGDILALATANSGAKGSLTLSGLTCLTAIYLS